MSEGGGFNFSNYHRYDFNFFFFFFFFASFLWLVARAELCSVRRT